jgi:hypothetical protein
MILSVKLCSACSMRGGRALAGSRGGAKLEAGCAPYRTRLAAGSRCRSWAALPP